MAAAGNAKWIADMEKKRFDREEAKRLELEAIEKAKEEERLKKKQAKIEKNRTMARLASRTTIRVQQFELPTLNLEASKMPTTSNADAWWNSTIKPKKVMCMYVCVCVCVCVCMYVCMYVWDT